MQSRGLIFSLEQYFTQFTGSRAREGRPLIPNPLCWTDTKARWMDGFPQPLLVPSRILYSGQVDEESHLLQIRVAQRSTVQGKE